MKNKFASQSAFFNARVLGAFVLCSAGALLALVALGAFAGSDENTTHVSQPVIGYLSVFNGDVRDLPQVPQTEAIERLKLKQPDDLKHLLSEAGVPQRAEPNVPLAPMPSPIQNFAGLSRTDSCVGGPCGTGVPPDTNGDVGPNHYIQAVNTGFAIYSKTGGGLARFTENQLFAQTGTPCDGNSRGDPVVLYDSMADRWILTNFAHAVDGNGNRLPPFYQCIAVSATSDPVSGGWHRYTFRMDPGGINQPPLNTLNDYPKFGIWTDGCLYYSANGFNASGDYTGGEWGTFPLNDMYAGLSTVTMGLGYVASAIDYYTMVPSNISGPAGNLPPAGRRNYYVQQSRDSSFSFKVRTVTPGPNCGGGGILSAATLVNQSTYDVPSGDIVPQPPPATSSNNLASLGDRIMQKVQYRRVGGTESLWVTHTFRSSGTGPTGSQWAQINVTSGTIATTPVQQQKYDPADGIYRWMSSIAADKDGNVALGYSTSSATSFPGIGYSGRLASDTPNMLPQSETQLVAGNGSQINNCGNPPTPCHRWGDYSAMSVDPDGCTFWYTNQYYVSQANASSGTWNTRIASFRFPSCGAGGTATPTPGGTPTPTPGATATPTATPNPTPTPPAVPTQFGNISTRLRVETGDNAMIGGFIITGTGSKKVIVRALGPSLPVPGALADPVIDVYYAGSGQPLAHNDNWGDEAKNRQHVIDSGLAPPNPLESARWGDIGPDAFTVVIRGNNNATGVGVFEVYDLDLTQNSKLGNISTRGFVSTGDNVMIGGTILVGSASARVVFRGMGPSLTSFGVPNALLDPTLELRDSNGALLFGNDNWQDNPTQAAAITAAGLAPGNNLEAAILVTLAPGAYTAILAGKNNSTGVALVEAYQLP